ncbi:MAG: hypothetical protein K0S08_644 [Gammaproteobacteria bacterium]|jgi:hypothetical protein|nr:hypothetical protein [Gammaproteobacteria bacterium]
MKKILLKIINSLISLLLAICFGVWLASFILYFGGFAILVFGYLFVPNPLIMLLFAFFYYAFPISYLLSRVDALRRLLVQEFKWAKLEVFLKFLPLANLVALVLLIIIAKALHISFS